MTATPDSHPYDTDSIRLTFRAVVQWSVPMICAVNLMHALALYRHGIDWWQWSLLVCLIEAPLFLITGQRRPFHLFLAGTLVLIFVITLQLDQLTRHFGPAPGFHLLLLAPLPVLMYSGRIPLWSKALGGGALILLILRLDMLGAPPQGFIPLDEDIIRQLRLINLTVVAAGIGAVSLIYFVLVARTQQQLARLAGSDPMTGLLNRRRMTEQASQSITLSRRQGFPLAVILGDIDHFKHTNDQYGHEVGDDAIRHVSRTLLDTVRDSDVVARWGGEEFLILLPNTDLETAYQVAERIRERLQDGPLQLASGSYLPLSMTLGVASLMANEDLAAVVHRADIALYAGKGAGRNRAVRA